MAGLDDILKALPIDQIAAKLGVDPTVATQAIQEGGGAILGGLQRNAATADGASAIEQALGKHTGMPDTVDVDQVDTVDGDKILGHIFGGNQGAVAQKLTDEPKTAGIDFGKLLPMLAPIVMGLLAKKGGSGAPEAAQSDAASQGSGGIGDLIGGLLGGGGGGGFNLDGMLGGIFGGRK